MSSLDNHPTERRHQPRSNKACEEIILIARVATIVHSQPTSQSDTPRAGAEVKYGSRSISEETHIVNLAQTRVYNSLSDTADQATPL